MSNMKPWLVIQELERENGKIFKQTTIEVEAFAKNNQFFEGLMLALHPLTTFGVKQVPESTVASTDTQELPWSDFVALTDELIARNLTGHAARDAIHDMMLASGQEQWNDWLRRILIQDMRAGFSESTVNKAVEKAKTPQYNIPVFSCQLANDSENYPKLMKGKKQVDIKLDGVRVLSILPVAADVKQTSRNGRQMDNFPHIRAQLEKFKEFLPVDFVVDAEVMSGKFQDLMKQVQRQSNVQTDDAVLHIFDILPLDEFLAGESKLTQQERNEFLTDYAEKHFQHASTPEFWELAFPNLSIVASEIIDLDTDEGLARLDVINGLAIDGGYEGIMLKDVDAVYLCKRTRSWLKLKPYIELDLKIVSHYKGKVGSKNENKLGGFTMVGDYELTPRFAKEFGLPVGTIIPIEVNCGGGFSDKQRIEFDDESLGGGSKLYGFIGEVRADCPSKSDSNENYSLRFPRFRRFRGFEAGEKI